MSLEDLGNLGELVAAVATLVTLAYLALQIRQSNRSHQLVAVTQLHDSSQEWLGQLVENDDVLEAYLAGMDAPETLTRDQRARFNLLVLQCLRGAEAGWIQSEWGLVDSHYWAGFREIIKHVVGSKGGRDAFQGNRRFLDPKFAAEVDRILSEID